MIHSARPTGLPVVNIVFAWNLFCFEKWGRTEDMCKNNDQYRPWMWVSLVDQYNVEKYVLDKLISIDLIYRPAYLCGCPYL